MLQWFILGLRFGSFTLPTAANPGIETGGLCGESKSAILDRVRGRAKALVAPYRRFEAGSELGDAALAAGPAFGWPMVVKPDVGCNGTGVHLVRNEAALRDVVRRFPRGVPMLVQAFVPHPLEAGLFYVRLPGEAHGRITSVTLKHVPMVVGDGRSTLRELVRADPRSGGRTHLSFPRLRARLPVVPPAGTAVPLVFTGNHCKGAVFEDGAHLVTPALTRQVDAFARAIPGFQFGRIDVRYVSDAALRAGTGFTVIEVNGTGSEATHIWDARCTLREAYTVQFRHYGWAWEIGRAMRARGHRPTGVRGLWRAWRRQQRLMASYPPDDLDS